MATVDTPTSQQALDMILAAYTSTMALPSCVKMVGNYLLPITVLVLA